MQYVLITMSKATFFRKFLLLPLNRIPFVVQNGMWCVEAQIAQCMQKTGHANTISHWRKTNNLNRRSKSKCTAIEILTTAATTKTTTKTPTKTTKTAVETTTETPKTSAIERTKKCAHICALASIRFRKRRYVQSILNLTQVQYKQLIKWSTDEPVLCWSTYWCLRHLFWFKMEKLNHFSFMDYVQRRKPFDFCLQSHFNRKITNFRFCYIKCCITQ